jgi:hypothetical protein
MYQYNELLAGRSKQNVLTGIVFKATGRQYGGCEVNAQAGIEGHRVLVEEKDWTMVD